MRKADNLPPYRAVVKKSESLNFLEPSGPAQACYGRALMNMRPVVAEMFHAEGQTGRQGRRMDRRPKLIVNFRDFINSAETPQQNPIWLEVVTLW